ALVGWGIAARPLELLPFVQRIGALLGLGCLGIWVARLLAPPATDDRRPTTDDRPPEAKTKHITFYLLPFTFTRAPLVRGADLPIYLAAAWWMGPLFQAIITADGARGVSPPATTAWIGGALALGLLGAGAWHRLRRPTTDDRRPTTDDSVTRSPLHPLTPSSAHP